MFERVDARSGEWRGDGRASDARASRPLALSYAGTASASPWRPGRAAQAYALTVGWMAAEASAPDGGAAGFLSALADSVLTNSALANSVLANSMLAKTLLVASCLVGGPLGTGCAETISNALALAYVGNPDLNQQRAATRAADEGVARANAGFRPQVVGTGSFGYNNQRESYAGGGAFGSGGTGLGGTALGGTGAAGTGLGGVGGGFVNGNSFPKQAAFTVTENLFNGNRTVNGVRQAESQVFAAREQTRATEQDTLQNGATAYMNVLRDTAILGLDRNNVIVLEEQLRETRERLALGEVTVTDVAQAAASLATARSTTFAAQASLLASVGTYRQVIGTDPGQLQPARPIDAMLPATLEEAIDVSLAEHPAIQAAFHNVDAAELQVKLNEGMLYPTLNVVGTVQAADQYDGIPTGRYFNASVLAQLNVPIYTGGDTYASIRQAKELLAQARLQADLQRTVVRANVVSNWGLLESSKAVIRSSREAVRSSEVALNGVREEAKAGQRTTLDVLNAQQALLQTRVSLVAAERDHVVASYAVDAATGRLSAANLALEAAHYDPTIHFDQVKDKWFGLRTPDGR